ncbi:hypothetical protein [Nocardia thraciensis]
MNSDTRATGYRRGVASAVVRLARFTRVRYEPHYLLYAVLFTLAVEGTAALVSGVQWRPGAATLVRIAVVAAVLLYLRMVDEQKDLDYDREYHPDRPLVTGAVRAGELRIAMGAIALVAAGGSLALSVRSAVMITAALVYGLVLWGLERLSATVRNAIMLNLAVTYPVQLFIIGYIVASAIDTGQARSGWAAGAVAVIFAGAFLQFEFARKTVHERHPGQQFYSNALGPIGSAATGVLCAVVAVACDLILVRPWEYAVPSALIAWIPLVLLVFPLWGTVEFARGGDSGGGRAARAPYPLVPSVVFVLTLYVALIVQALVLS